MIMNLPKECYVVLSSPVPIIVGLNSTSEKVFREIIPQFCEIKQCNLFVFLDEGFIYTMNKDEKNIIIPQNNNFVENLQKLYKDHVNDLKSKSVRIKKDKNQFFFFK